MKKYLLFPTFLFALATIAFGAIELVTGNFHQGLLPVPVTVPGRSLLAYTSGIIFVVLGTGLFFKRWRTVASFYLGILWLLFFVLLHLVLLSTDIYNAGEWTATFEVLIMCCGAVFVNTFNTHAFNDGSGHFRKINGKLFVTGRYALALSLLVFAILHFKYADYISTLIPAWIPGKLFLAYFIGVAFLLTTISIIVNKLVTLSTGLIGYMFLLWVFILHSPRALAASNSEPEWTSLFVALSSSATCLLLSYLSKNSSGTINTVDELYNTN